MRDHPQFCAAAEAGNANATTTTIVPSARKDFVLDRHRPGDIRGIRAGRRYCRRPWGMGREAWRPARNRWLETLAGEAVPALKRICRFADDEIRRAASCLRRSGEAPRAARARSQDYGQPTQGSTALASGGALATSRFGIDTAGFALAGDRVACPGVLLRWVRAISASRRATTMIAGNW